MASGDFWEDIEGNKPDPLDEDPTPWATAYEKVHHGVELKRTPATKEPPESAIVYNGLSAQFKPGSSLQEKLDSTGTLTRLIKAGPLLLGDLFNELYRDHNLSDEEIGQHFNLADGTVKNVRMWARKIPPENRVEGIETTLAQEASSIRNTSEQRDFIQRALKEGLNKAEMRAVKSGREPGDADHGNDVGTVKCPTCGSRVRAELLS